MSSANDDTGLAAVQAPEKAMKPIQISANSDNGIKSYDNLNIGHASDDITSSSKKSEKKGKCAGKHPKMSKEDPPVGFFEARMSESSPRSSADSVAEVLKVKNSAKDSILVARARENFWKTKG